MQFCPQTQEKPECAWHSGRHYLLPWSNFSVFAGSTPFKQNSSLQVHRAFGNVKTGSRVLPVLSFAFSNYSVIFICYFADNPLDGIQRNERLFPIMKRAIQSSVIILTTPT